MAEDRDESKLWVDAVVAVLVIAAVPLPWQFFTAAGTGRGLVILDRTTFCAGCAVDVAELDWLANLERATALAPRLVVSAGCSEATLVDLGLETPVVGARGCRAIVGGAEGPEFDDDDDNPFGWLAAAAPELEATFRPRALLWGRDVEETDAALLAVAGVRGLDAADPDGDALLAALIEDEDADDTVLTCDGRR